MARPPRARVQIIAMVWAGVAVAASLVAVTLVLLITDAGRGLDPTDEATYLLATHPRHPGAAFNGLFGYYTGLLLGAVGNNLELFRIAGYLILGAAFGGAGAALGRLVAPVHPGPDAVVVRGIRVILVLGAAAGGLLYYTLFLRTPSYNWLALVGVALALHGLVRSLLGEITGRAAWWTAALIAGGCFLAFWAKSTTGVAGTGLAALVLLTAVPAPALVRWLALGRVAVVGAVLLGLHLIFVLGPGATVSAYRRSVDVLAAVDPEYYSISGSLRHFFHDLAALPADLVSGVGFLGLLVLVPVAAVALPRSIRGVGIRTATGLACGGLGALLLFTRFWRGGAAGYGPGALAAFSVLLVALVGWVVVALSRRAGQGDRPLDARRAIVVALVLVVFAGAYAFGSNNGFVAQLTGAVGLLLLAAAVLAAAPLRPAADLPAAARAPWAAGVVGLLLCVAAPVVLAEGRATPYRIEPLAADTVPIGLGRYGGTVKVDAASAASYRAIVDGARAHGWRQGTPLLDMSFTPSLALMMDADVPVSLLPVIGGFPTGTSSAVETLSYQPRAWSDRAWLLVDPDSGAVDPEAVVGSLGRSLAKDYVRVASAPRPTGDHMVLYRPR